MKFTAGYTLDMCASPPTVSLDIGAWATIRHERCTVLLICYAIDRRRAICCTRGWEDLEPSNALRVRRKQVVFVCFACLFVAWTAGLLDPVTDVWNKTLNIDTNEQDVVASFSLEVFSANLVADLVFVGNTNMLELSLAFDICIHVIFIGQLCGGSIAQYIPGLDDLIPYVVFNDTVNLAGMVTCGDDDPSNDDTVSRKGFRTLPLPTVASSTTQDSGDAVPTLAVNAKGDAPLHTGTRKLALRRSVQAGHRDDRSGGDDVGREMTNAADGNGVSSGAWRDGAPGETH